MLTTLVACTGDNAPDLVAPEAMHPQIATSVGESLAQVNAAVARTRELLPTASTLTRLTHLFGNQTPLARLAASVPVLPGPIDGAAIVKLLDERVFTDAAYEGRGSYRFDPSLVCAAEDRGCVALVERLGLRLLVAIGDTSDTLVFDVRIGADAPVHVTLTPVEVNVSVDLDVLQRSAPQLSAAFGLPALEMSGAFSAWSRTRDSSASLFVAIDRPVALRAGDELAFSSEKLGIVLSALAFSSDDLGSVTLDLGATKAMRRIAGKQRALDFAALTADLALFPFTHHEPLVLNNLSFGDRPAVFSNDGVPAQSVAINPDDADHSVNVFFQTDDGVMLADASPRLDLRSVVDHAVLGEPVPPFEVTRVQLDGRLSATSDDRFEVVRGDFAITTTPARAGFAAAAGQCVTTRDAPLAWTVGGCE